MTSSLTIDWAFGFSKDINNSVHCLSTVDRTAILFVSSYSGVIYDYENRTQIILQGHCNVITSCVVSLDKRWIVTSDNGPDPIIVIWDSLTGVPVKTLISPHVGGVSSIDLSSDSLFLCSVGVGNFEQQELAIWAWTSDEPEPVIRQDFPVASNDRVFVRFDLSQHSQFVTWSQDNVLFWGWENNNVQSYQSKISKADIGNFTGSFTACTYLNDTGNVVTCTSEGYVILWEEAVPSSKYMKKPTKVCSFYCSFCSF